MGSKWGPATLVLACALVAGCLAQPASAAVVPMYEQPISFEWDRKDLDVLIVPPHHGQLLNGRSGTRLLGGRGAAELNPLANSYIAALTQAIADWQKAIRTFGSRSLRQLKLNVYVLGRDVPPLSALQRPEILFTWDETKLTILGVSTRTGDTPCVVSNSMLALNSFSAPDMYNIAGHEFGHCLGIDHATGSRGIQRDILFATYNQPIGHEGNELRCMSNLNVRTLELVYDGRDSPASASIPASEYTKIRCG